MSKNLLLEIGTEEVPAHVMPGILKELGEKAEKALKENRVAFESVRTIGTPRRTALLVQGLAESQEDVESENRGPSVQIAFDADGNPTKAAQGFARGQKVDPKDLVVKDGYVYLNDKPGWGIELNEELCKAHPAIPSYTPQLTRPDGAVCDW